MKKTTLQNLIIIIGLVFCAAKIHSDNSKAVAAKSASESAKAVNAIKLEKVLTAIQAEAQISEMKTILN